MRVPEARSTVRISTVSTPTASPDDFGAAVGRGMEAVGGQVSKLGNQVMDLAIEQKRQKTIREAEDGYTSWIKEANGIYQTEVAGRVGSQTDDLLDDPANPENSGFRKNFVSKLDDSFKKVSENLSPNARKRLGVMVQNQRLALETRAQNHVFTQQREAAKVASGVALGVAQESAAEQARTYTKKGADGAVSIQWSEVDRVMGDVISAQSIYNARHGVPAEITLEDGTKKNILQETARQGAHQKAFEVMMASGEYDEAQAYLDGLTAEKRPDGSANPYFGDLDAKQVKETQDAIKKGKADFDKARQIESNQAVVGFFLKNGRAPGAAERSGMNLTAETVQALESGRMELISPALEGVAALSVRQQILDYDPENDPDQTQLLGMMMRIDGFKDGGAKKFLTQKLNETLEVHKDPVKGVDALVKTQIEDALIAGGYKDTDKNKALTRAITLERAAYEQWVAEKNPTPDERLKYAKTGRFADLAKTKDREVFRARLVQGYSSPETAGISKVRGVVQQQYGMPTRKVIGVKRDSMGNVIGRQYDDGSIETVRPAATFNMRTL